MKKALVWTFWIVAAMVVLRYEGSIANIIKMSKRSVLATTEQQRLVDDAEEILKQEKTAPIEAEMKKQLNIIKDPTQQDKHDMAFARLKELKKQSEDVNEVTSTIETVKNFLKEEEFPKENLEKIQSLTTIEWKALEKGYDEPQLFEAHITKIEATPDGGRVYLTIRYDHLNGSLKGWLKNRTFVGTWSQSNNLRGKFSLTFDEDFTVADGWRYVGANPNVAPQRFLKISQ